jgi:uncharacterized protein (TIGR03435 family)
MNLADHLWQSTAFAAVAGLLTLALRTNRARVRHWLWFAASVKFLLPLSVLIALGNQIEWKTPVAQPEVSAAVGQIVEPFAGQAMPLVVPTQDLLPDLLFGLWAVGVVVISSGWLVRWGRIRQVVRNGKTLQMEVPLRVVLSSTQLEPGVFGLFRPVLVLPDGIFDRLTAAQLRAIVAHELCHVRHRDNLLAAIHMFVETVFWFHPLVWWIGHRMVEERERACDEEVLRTLGEPQAYAEGILNVCRLYLESPLTCVSGVTGADLKKRIEAIMKHRSVFGLSPIKKLVLAAAGIAAIAVPFAVGVLQAQGNGLLQDLGRYAFEVATVRPAKPGQGKSLGSGAMGHFEATGVTLQGMILAAYGGTSGSLPKERLVGGPKWIDSDLWDVVGQAPGGSGGIESLLKMLQTLLQERFHLRIHVEQRRLPVFALTVSKQGKITRSKVDCMALMAKEDETGEWPEDFWCGLRILRGGPWKIMARGVALAELTRRLELFPSIARPVVDRTGLAGTWDFELTYLPVDPGAADRPVAPSIFTALQEQAGLKLESSRAPVEVLVVDQAEMPEQN